MGDPIYLLSHSYLGMTLDWPALCWPWEGTCDLNVTPESLSSHIPICSQTPGASEVSEKVPTIGRLLLLISGTGAGEALTLQSHKPTQGWLHIRCKTWSVQPLEENTGEKSSQLTLDKKYQKHRQSLHQQELGVRFQPHWELCLSLSQGEKKMRDTAMIEEQSTQPFKMSHLGRHIAKE